MHLKATFSDGTIKQYNSVSDVLNETKVILKLKVTNEYDEDIQEFSTDRSIIDLLSATNIRSLKLVYCIFDHDIAQDFSVALRKNTSLLELNFAECTFYQNNISFVATGLTFNRTLKKLKITNHDYPEIHEENIYFFAGMIACNSSLTHLILWNNDLKKGFSALADAIVENKTLEHLELNCSQFGYMDEVNKKLSHIIKRNKTLKFISLNYSDLENDTALAIAEALETNRTLVSLNLSDNRFTDKILPKFNKMIRNNFALRSIDLQDQFPCDDTNTDLHVDKNIFYKNRLIIAHAVINIAAGKVTPLDFKILHLAFNHYQDVLMDDIAKILKAESDPEIVRNIIKAARNRYITLTDGLSKTDDEGLFAMLTNAVRLMVRDYALPEAVDTFRLKEEEEEKAKSTQNQIAK